MYGIVTIVDGERGAQIRRVWADLARRYGDDAIEGFNLPHLSYHVADDYDREAISALLQRLAAETKAFRVPARGLGVIPSRAARVLFISVVRTPGLSALHEALWDGATAVATNTVEHYGRNSWFPHVTLTDRAVALDSMGKLADAMGDGRLPSEIAIDNLALIEETDEGHEVRLRVDLRRR